MQTNETLASGNEPDRPKDTIMGLSKRLVNGSIATGAKLSLTPFGFHVVNAVLLLILLIVVGINIGPALEGQYVKVATVIKSFSIFTFLLSLWFMVHQKIMASTIYLTSILIVYFTLLQVLSNSMYGSMAQLAVLCLFQVCLLALLTVIVSLVCEKKGISPLASIS